MHPTAGYHPGMNQWLLKMAFTRPPLSLNDRFANYHQERSLQKGVAHDVTAVALKAIKDGALPAGLLRVAVELIYYPANNGRRDADNIAATLKPIMDGLVDAKVIPDDKAEHVVRTSQRIVLARDDPYARRESECWIVVTDASDMGPLFHAPPN